MVQPLLVSISAVTLATETVRSILKIDDLVRHSTELAQRFYLLLVSVGWTSSRVFVLISGEHSVRGLES